MNSRPRSKFHSSRNVFITRVIADGLTMIVLFFVGETCKSPLRFEKSRGKPENGMVQIFREHYISVGPATHRISRKEYVLVCRIAGRIEFHPRCRQSANYGVAIRKVVLPCFPGFVSQALFFSRVQECSIIGLACSLTLTFPILFDVIGSTIYYINLLDIKPIPLTT